VARAVAPPDPPEPDPLTRAEMDVVLDARGCRGEVVGEERVRGVVELEFQALTADEAEARRPGDPMHGGGEGDLDIGHARIQEGAAHAP
jgi:hypothetical protein